MNNVDEPLTLFAPECSSRAFSLALQTNSLGKEFALIVSAAPPWPAGSLQGQITIKTSSTNVPVLNIGAWLQVQPALTVVPPQITLPLDSLGSNHTATVTIINNSTNKLGLSDPAINSTNVDIQIKEVRPGSQFVAMLTFGPQFEVAQGQPVFFTIKTSHPQLPLIRVPIYRAARPLSAANPSPRRLLAMDGNASGTNTAARIPTASKAIGAPPPSLPPAIPHQ